MGILDAPGLSKAQADTRYTRRSTAQQLFGALPGPISAGRPLRPNGFMATTGAYHQSVHRVTSDAPQIRLVFPLFGMPGSNNLTPEQVAGPITVKAGVIWNYNGGSGSGVPVPVFFSGQRTVTTSFGQLFLISDPVDVSPSQGVGSYFVVRARVDQAPRTVTDGATNTNTTVTSATANFIAADINAAISGTGIPGGATILSVVSATQVTISAAATATATGVSLTITPKYVPSTRPPISGLASSVTNGWIEGFIVGGAVDYTDNGGNNFASATNDSANLFAPAVCGWGRDGYNRTVALFGDSIAAGTGWSIEAGSFSFVSWTLDQANIGCLNLGHGGEQLVTVLSSYAYYRARLSSAYGLPNAVDEYGINDLFAGSRTATQLKADMLTWWGFLAKKGCTVFRTTLTPRTNSSDAWRTTGNQTSANSGAEVYRQQVNQWLRAPASAGAGASAAFDAAAAGISLIVFDTAAPLEANANGSAITINPATGAISNGAGGFFYTEATVYDSGTANSIPSSTKLADSTKTWTAGQWVDYAMVITADSVTPAAVGQVRIIAANSTSQLTSDSAWTTNPSTSATYQIVKVFTGDGTHPTTFGHKLMAAKFDTSQLIAG